MSICQQPEGCVHLQLAYPPWLCSVCFVSLGWSCIKTFCLGRVMAMQSCI